MSIVCYLAISVALVGLAQQNPQQTTSRPAEPESRPAGFRRPQQAAILEQLLREKETVRPILPVPAPETLGQGVPATSRPAGREPLLLEGTVLVERSGRLVLERDVYYFEYFEFDAVETHRGLRRMILLENQLLEQVLHEAESGAERFRTSGEVTRFRGRNYLLLEKAERVIDHGNLGP